jgi:hypothetical protein
MNMFHEFRNFAFILTAAVLSAVACFGQQRPVLAGSGQMALSRSARKAVSSQCSAGTTPMRLSRRRDPFWDLL